MKPSHELRFHLTKDIYAPVEVHLDSLILDLNGSDWVDHEELHELVTLCVHTQNDTGTGLFLYASVWLRDDHGVLGVPLQSKCIETRCIIDQNGIPVLPTVWCAWGDMVTFPVKYRDLDPSTQFCVTIWCSNRSGSSFRVLGGSAVSLFNEYGRLLMARQNLEVTLGEVADGLVVPCSAALKEGLTFNSCDSAKKLQWLEMQQEKLNCGQIEEVSWLDDISTNVLKETVFALRSSQGKRRGLEIKIILPKFDHDVFFSDSDVSHPGVYELQSLHQSSTQRMTRETQASSLHAFITSEEVGNNDKHLITFYDPEINRESPAEAMHQKLARSMARETENPRLRPNTQEKAQLDRIIKYPPSKALTREERDIIWKFRYSITNDRNAINKFLKSVDWVDAEESSQACKLMETWAKIDVGDALEMLSPVFQNEKVRSYAILYFRSVNDDVLQSFLLQLVQALRYQDQDQSQLSDFLLERARKNPLIASSLFWYLCSEIEDESFGTRAQVLQKHLIAELDTVECDASLPLQLSLLARLRHLSDSVKSYRSADIKTEQIRNLLGPGGSCEDLSHFSCPNPLDPSVTLSGIIPEMCLVFKSKVNPIKFSWNTIERNGFQKTTSFIYKRGDDLRQDQLVLQIFSVMDSLLKKEHLDLQITSYRVLPTAVDDGLIQFVPNAVPLSYILRDHGGILQYLELHGKSSRPEARSDVLNNYIRSCAGYTVFTHILGVGDRHNDNVMLTDEGKLFHIDFGYFLGKDPKFSTAPLFLSRTIVDGMGGPESDDYQHFVQLACEAFNILRKSAGLLLAVIHVMASSSIPDIRSDPETAMLKVQEKMWLDLSDEDAAKAFESTLIAAQNAVLPRIAEVQHRVAQGWR